MSIADRVVHRMLRLPAPARPYAVQRDLRVPMRDGVALLADVWSPTGAVRGTLLVRSPYGRAGAVGTLLARPYALQGFRVVSVSCRATLGSEGEVNAFFGEVEDGHDTVAWMREQPWFDGRFATIGVSYLGLTQWAILTDPPAELKAAVIISGPHDTGRLMYDTGAMNLFSTTAWTHGILTQGDQGPVAGLVKGLLQKDKPYRHVFEALPIQDAATATWGDRAPWLDAWLAHTDPSDPWWDAGRVTTALTTTEIPVLLYSGWNDLILPQVLESYAALADRGVDVQLVVGPWSHAELSTKGAQPSTHDALGWFAEHLAHDGTRTQRGPVRIEVGGGGGWRDLPAWPPKTEPRTLHLQPGGGLADRLPREEAVPSRFTYDPLDPTPSVGGMSNALDAGRRDNTAKEERADVLTFTGEPLTEALEIIGSPEVELVHTTDNPHVDWFVRLCEVDAKGRSWNLSEAFVRRHEGDGVLRVALSPTAHRFAPGTRIRLQVSGGAHPVYDRNLGTGELAAFSRETRPSTRTIAHGLGGRSTLTLPVA